MSRANCFIVVSPDQGSLEAGSVVSVIPFSELRV
jgi:molybdopterin biosynthesis enzyme